MDDTAFDRRAPFQSLDLTRAHLSEALGIVMSCLDHDARSRQRRQMALRAHAEAIDDRDMDAWMRLRPFGRR